MPSPPEPIAIVGMGCVFPGAADLTAYWDNIERGVDAISPVPAGRWDPVYFAPEKNQADRFYCRRGGFVDAQAKFDPLAFGVMPRAAEGADPDQLLALHVAHQALEDAGLPLDGAWREKAGVVLGRGGYITPGLARLEQRVRTAQQLVELLRAQVPGMTEEALEEVKAKFQAELGPYGPDTAIGLVPNLAASRIANRLDLLGPAYTVDAACASSLLAVDQAARELWSGRCDVMLAGGVHLCQDVTFWSVFTQLGALSRTEQIRPFDRRADGLLIGEGVGVVVLKRLSDAARDGDRVYARLLSVGISSDGKGTSLLEPRADGQLLALERAWKASGADARDVDYVEAHGTGTVRGDEAELTTLGRFFGEATGRRAALGSVKSMIGHAMPAAGAAGLIRTALALHHGVIPPSLHCEEPHPLLARTRFTVPGKSEPWPEGGPRRLAGVNAFGFGGINTHAVLEGTGRPVRARRGAAASARPAGQAETWAALSARTPAALDAALEQGTPLAEGGPLRLVLFNPTPERRALARKVVARERPWNGHDDVWFAPRGLLTDGGKTAFLFPGLEPTFEPRADDVAEHFGLPLAAASGFKGIEGTGLRVILVSRLLHEALRQLKVVPQALAGHSLGEWTGMLASEMIPPAEAQRFIDALVPDTLAVPDVFFVAAGCSAERAAEAMRGLPEIALSHDNCPHQVILCGRKASVDTALARLAEMQVLAQKLPFQSGFHSALFAPYLGAHRESLAGLALQKPAVPLWSATRCAPYPDEPEQIRALALEHLVQPVRFRQLLERLYEQGFRFFVQVGWGTSLTGFVEDTLKGKPFLSVSANVKARPGVAQLRRVLAAAFCAGMDVDLSQLDPKHVAKPLRLDVPLVRLPKVAAATPSFAAPPGAGGPLQREFAASMQKLAQAQAEVLAAFANDPAPRESVEKRRLSVETHPYLLDHCFYRQPKGFSDDERFPVVPGTASLQWLHELAQATSGKPVHVIEDFRAHRWLAVAPPVEVTLRATPEGAGRISLALEGFSEATALPGAEPQAWSPPPPLVDARPCPVRAAAIYEDRWLFHGPRYQGVKALHGMSAQGIDGELEMQAAPGALLDNAGQLLGFWVMQHTEVDRMAFPVWLHRVELFGPPPREGERLHCAVRIRALEERDVRGDLWLWHVDGRPYCRIQGWQDRRFDTDPRLWDVLQWPEKHALSVRRPAGYVLVTDAWKSLPSRELLARRYLRSAERAAWEQVPLRRQGPWLNGRIAAKDAAREHLWARGAGELFPADVEVLEEAGKTTLRGAFPGPLHVSLAAVDGAAVARVDERGPVGIDLERAEGGPAGDRSRVAKRAVARSRGLDPDADGSAWAIQKVEGERLLIDGQWVDTTWDAPFIVAWSHRA